MVRPGQPESRPALGSAGRGCRRAGCGSRQRRRRRATAAAVTGKNSAGGAAHDGEGGGARGEARRQRGRGGGKLSDGAHGDRALACVHAKEKRQGGRVERRMGTGAAKALG